MTEPITSMSPEQGLFTATTRYFAPGVDGVRQIQSTQLSRAAATEKLREQLTSVASDNPEYLHATIVRDSAAGSVAVLDTEGLLPDVEARVDHELFRIAAQTRRPAWEVAAGPLTAPAAAQHRTATPPASHPVQPVTNRTHTTQADRGWQR